MIEKNVSYDTIMGLLIAKNIIIDNELNKVKNNTDLYIDVDMYRKYIQREDD